MQPQLPNPYLESKVNLRKARASPPIKVNPPNRAAPPADFTHVLFIGIFCVSRTKVPFYARALRFPSNPENNCRVQPQVPNSVVESKVDLPNRAAPPTDLGFEKVILPNRAIRAAPSADLEEEVYHLPNRTSPKAESLKMTIQTRVSGLRKDFLGDATPADSSPTAYLL